MFGFRPTELIVIFVIALLVFGPKKLPEMGAQLGRGLNAFRKGMREINREVGDTDPFDLETFTTQQREIRALEARRLELEILERELAVKRAEAALKATQEAVMSSPYSIETTVEADYADSDEVVEAASVASTTIVESDPILSEETDRRPVVSADNIESVESIRASNSLE